MKKCSRKTSEEELPQSKLSGSILLSWHHPEAKMKSYGRGRKTPA